MSDSVLCNYKNKSKTYIQRLPKGTLVECLPLDFSSGHDLRVLGSSSMWGSVLRGHLLEDSLPLLLLASFLLAFYSLRFIFFYLRWGRAEGEKESPADSPLNTEPDVGLNPATPRS